MIEITLRYTYRYVYATGHTRYVFSLLIHIFDSAMPADTLSPHEITLR